MMRPPMGAGFHTPAAPKGNTMGFVMPLYTIGIISFFLYTILKVCRIIQVNKDPRNNCSVSRTSEQIVFKKSPGQAEEEVYGNGSMKVDPSIIQSQMYPTNTADCAGYVKRPDNGASPKLGESRAFRTINVRNN